MFSTFNILSFISFNSLVFVLFLHLFSIIFIQINKVNTTLQKFGVGYFFYVFERNLLSSPRLHLFDQKYSNQHNIMKYYYNLR